MFFFESSKYRRKKTMKPFDVIPTSTQGFTFPKAYPDGVIPTSSHQKVWIGESFSWNY
jgi:hypothetical protein